MDAVTRQRQFNDAHDEARYALFNFWTVHKALMRTFAWPRQ